MKQIFSLNWISSKNRRKQRKYIANAPLHVKGKFLNVQLSKTLAKKHSLRSIRIRKGDKVKVMSGQYKGKASPVAKVDLKNTKVHLENIFNLKRDGSKSYYPIHPSNLQIQELNMDDKKRTQKIESLSKTTKKEDKK